MMEYTITVTQQEIQILFQGLGELPLKATLNLFAKMQAQVSEQDAANAVPLEEMVQ